MHLLGNFPATCLLVPTRYIPSLNQSLDKRVCCQYIDFVSFIPAHEYSVRGNVFQHLFLFFLVLPLIFFPALANRHCTSCHCRCSLSWSRPWWIFAVLRCAGTSAGQGEVSVAGAHDWAFGESVALWKEICAFAEVGLIYYRFFIDLIFSFLISISNERTAVARRNNGHNMNLLHFHFNVLWTSFYVLFAALVDFGRECDCEYQL